MCSGFFESHDDLESEDLSGWASEGWLLNLWVGWFLLLGLGPGGLQIRLGVACAKVMDGARAAGLDLVDTASWPGDLCALEVPSR